MSALEARNRVSSAVLSGPCGVEPLAGLAWGAAGLCKWLLGSAWQPQALTLKAPSLSPSALVLGGPQGGIRALASTSQCGLSVAPTSGPVPDGTLWGWGQQPLPRNSWSPGLKGAMPQGGAGGKLLSGPGLHHSD